MDTVTRARLILLVLAIMLVIAIGRIHFVAHAGRFGVALCHKESWSLRDTFVDYRDYIDQPVRLVPAKPKVVMALLACEIAPNVGDEADLYWQALEHESRRLGNHASINWGGGLYMMISGSEEACKQLKPFVILVGPTGHTTSCDGYRASWTIHR